MAGELLPGFSWLGRLWGRGGRATATAKRWPVLQVEVTSRCLTRCVFCPNRGPTDPSSLSVQERTEEGARPSAGEGARGARSKGLAGQWECADLPWEVFRDHIGPHLARFETVYLQGWGEPLLHPDLWRMAQLAKESGCRVGFTSCGSLLLEDAVTQILDGGIDILSVSFAGATAGVHESLRIGSSFDRLTANVRQLAECRTAARSGLFLELHYLMMRPNIHELPAFVRLAADLGADEVVATNLTYAFTPELDALRVCGPTPAPTHLALVAGAEREAARLGIRFRAYPLTINDAVLECDAQPTATAFINCRGEMTPCVYLGMPVVGTAPRYFEGVAHPLAPVSFGRVEDGFMAAWEGRPRRDFNALFAARRTAGYTALLLAGTGGEAGELPAPPEPCRHCYKMFGV
ncbi:MAG: radical SAM protein [Anaerolineae bacterium]|nr:radical SAM protein [Anaerolineae bacterium]